MRIARCIFAAAVCVLSTSLVQAGADWGLTRGTPELKSAGPLAFGPEGILFIGDRRAAAVIAVNTGDTSMPPRSAKLNLPDVTAALATLLNAKPQQIQIQDLAVNPLNQGIYLSVHVQSANGSEPVIVREDGNNKLKRVSLEKVPFARVELEDAPEDKVYERRGRKMNLRDSSITDLAYSDGKVLVAGVSKGEGRGKSTIREFTLPFTQGQKATNVEIYHGAHGRFENYAPIRTFIPMTIDGEPSLLAGFTCTPLVKFPVDSLGKQPSTRGTTVAELGNRNTPLDMIVYKKDGEEFVLMANDRRGVMKISTAGIDRETGITERVRGTAGQKYETIESWQGVVQMGRYYDESAVVLQKGDDGKLTLKTVPLP